MSIRSFICLRAVVLLLVLLPISVFAQAKPDIVIFDEDDPTGVGYYDASWGFSNGGSVLTLGGPNSPKDKLIIDTTYYYTGHNSGLLQWKSVSGGDWGLFISSWGWASKDVSGYDSVVIYMNGRYAVPAVDLPKIGLEDGTNTKTSTVNLSDYLPSGIDADTTTWQRVSIPLSAFAPYPTGFSLANFKDVNFHQGAADDSLHTLWVDNIRIVAKVSQNDTTTPAAPKNLVSLSGDQSAMLYWDWSSQSNLAGYNVYRSSSMSGSYTKLNSAVIQTQDYADVSVTNSSTYYYFVRGVNTNQVEGPGSDTVNVTPQAFASDSTFLDLVQHTAFNYFWYEANPSNGLVRDRSEQTSAASIAAVGFGLTGIGIAVDHGWITRQAGADRTLTTLKTFWNGPEGTASTGTIGYKGWFYHFLGMNTAVRAGSSELSSIDTGLLLAGILYSKQYFTGTDTTETQIRSLADSIFNRADWNWMTNGDSSLTMGWQPESGFIGARWIGYNEGMILNIMGIGASLPASVWNSWTSGYSWQTYYGYSYVNFPPLFGHQYSQCWIDYRNIADNYMKNKDITYFQNSRLATLAQRQYCIANPGGFTGYGPNIWGLTACDGPGSTGYHGYIARGAPPAMNDDGTIAPTAAGGSIAFTPEYSVPTLRYMYNTYRANIWMGYGFRDAFNLKANWWGPDVIGIDQGPIMIMIENYRTQRVWNTFMKNPVIQDGLAKAGFTTVTGISENKSGIPTKFDLEQNYPNPFNPSTVISYQLSPDFVGIVTLKVYDVLGREVATLVNERQNPGSYTVKFDASRLPNGVYFYRIVAGDFTSVRKMAVIK